MKQNNSSNLTKKDFISNQQVRWCPGCGDYAILSAIQKTCPQLDIPKENFVFVSGIGCASRLPYYMNTYGFHTIHGRAPSFATGIKIANPDLMVWVITGDGDALSIGGNHFIHLLRRNVNVNYLLINNQIYGLTKGQYSPTSAQGQKTKSTPQGSIETPINPVKLAIASGASFVSRVYDTDVKGMEAIFLEASKHQGTSFIEIYQNCNIFNDKVFEKYTHRDTKEDTTIFLEDQKPLIFGKNKDKGIRLKGFSLEVVDLNKEKSDNLLIHSVKEDSELQAYLYSTMDTNPNLPAPFGIFRKISKGVYETTLEHQVKEAKKNKPTNDYQTLLQSGQTWKIK